MDPDRPIGPGGDEPVHSPDEKPSLLHGVELTNLGVPLIAEDPTTKRDLIDYLVMAADHLLPELADRPLSVIRVPHGGRPFMQKNLPDHAPGFVRRERFWAEASQRWVSYAVCDDVRALVWFGNQRTIEFHPALVTASRPDHMSHIVLDIDPPPGDHFDLAVRAALLVKTVLDEVGMKGVVKTSGATGVHVLVPLASDVTLVDAVGTTRAIAERAAALDPDLATVEFKKADRRGRVFIDATRFGSATVVAAFSPRARPGLPVSFPVAWDRITDVHPSDFTINTASEHLRDPAPWLDSLPDDQRVPADLLARGRELTTTGIQGMRREAP